MRIVTRPDFDGVVCAVLLYEAENVNVPVKWVEPNDMQKGIVDIHEGDIVANLPYDERCALWFDHHQRQASFLNIIKTDLNSITAN
jgi:oligoribonuclease NrnB/cAMP/cGMP phosphodiesterase (DHH superfamily)